LHPRAIKLDSAGLLRVGARITSHSRTKASVGYEAAYGPPRFAKNAESFRSDYDDIVTTLEASRGDLAAAAFRPGAQHGGVGRVGKPKSVTGRLHLAQSA